MADVVVRTGRERVRKGGAVHSPEDLRQLALGDQRMWLVVSARYFQTLGFYTELIDLPNDALLDAIGEAVRWHWDGPLPPEEVARDMQLADMILLDGSAQADMLNC